MKKIILSLLTVMIITVFVSCGDTDTECAHSWSAATCTEAAVCELCGIEGEGALGHTIVKGNVYAPTCTDAGYTAYNCSNCDFTATADEVPPIGHNLVEDWVFAPTCTDGGFTVYSCTNCDLSVVDDEVSALGHDLVVKSVFAPTCKFDGHTVYGCSNCEFIVIDDKVAAAGHEFGEWINNDEIKLCDKVSVLTRTCSVCQETEVENSIPTSHKLVSHEAKAPTCTEPGHKEYNTCENCDYTTFEVIPAGHTYETTVLPPTCINVGYTTHTCSGCGDSYNDSYEDATGHTMGAWYQSSDATTTHDGEMRSSCLNCAHYETKGLTVVVTGNFGAGSSPSASATYTLYENGTLKISGTGATYGCGWNGANQPFKEYRDRITKLVIGEGITENTAGDFANLYNLTSVEFPTTFKQIKTNAFMDSFKKGITTITIPKQVTYIGCFIFGYYATDGAVFTDIIIENPDITFYTNPSSPKNELSIFNRGNHNSSITLYSYGAENNVSAYAAKIGAKYVDLNAEISGTAGDISYKFFEGELTLSALGTAATLPADSPWLARIDKADVKRINVGEGITSIPADYFTDYTSLKEVVLSESVSVVSDRAFAVGNACDSSIVVYLSESISALGEEIFKNRTNVTVHGFSGTPAESYTEQGVTVLLQKVFRLLLLGNSLSLDAADNSGGGTASILYDIIKSMLGENSYVEIATLYSGARTAAWHATMARDECAAYQFSVISDDTDGKWRVVSNSCTSKYGLEYADWDVVTIQPYGNETLTGVDDTTTGISNSYKDDEFLPMSVSLPFLLDYIKEYSENSEIYYYLTWASSQSAWMNTGANNYSTMVDVALVASAHSGEVGSFSGVIPVGTAIQNARSTYLSLLRYDNSSDVQKNLQRDGVHLSLHVGRYIAALTFAELLVPQSMRDADYELPVITDSPTAGTLPIGYTEIAREAVNEAVASASLEGSQRYRPTTISGYGTDPSNLLATAIEKMSFSDLKASDEAALIAAIKAIIDVNALDGTVITVTLDAASDLTSFSATVTVRYGYMEASVQISGTASA